MKLLLIIMVSLSTLSAASDGELPKDFHGRWFCDEATTLREWADRAKTPTERSVANSMLRILSEMKKQFGKPLLNFLDISATKMIAGDSVMNPKFEIFSVTEKAGIYLLKTRHFQADGDDNPKVENVLLSRRDGSVIFELRDEEGTLCLLYVLKNKKT